MIGKHAAHDDVRMIGSRNEVTTAEFVETLGGDERSEDQARVSTTGERKTKRDVRQAAHDIDSLGDFIEQFVPRRRPLRMRPGASTNRTRISVALYGEHFQGVQRSDAGKWRFIVGKERVIRGE
jgi:hypothetical protein